MTTLENKYIAIKTLKDKGIVVGTWNETDDDFTNDTFKENMLAWFEEVKKLGNVNVLADARKFNFMIDPDTQIWVNEHVIGQYPDYGVAKLGFLVSPDVFAQVSIEQTIEEKEQAFEVQYFEDEAVALEWLTRS